MSYQVHILARGDLGRSRDVLRAQHISSPTSRVGERFVRSRAAHINDGERTVTVDVKVKPVATAVVFGATGYAGSAIAAELDARGHSVVGVARDVSSVHPGIEARAGSVTDKAFFADVTAQAAYVVLATHALLDGKTKLSDLLPDLLASMTTLPSRLGVVGGAGSLRISEDGPLFMEIREFPDFAKPEAKAQADLYATLRLLDTNLDWFYLSPPAGFGAHVAGERTGHYRIASGDLMLTRDGSPSDISGADYATAFTDELERPSHHRARATVGY